MTDARPPGLQSMRCPNCGSMLHTYNPDAGAQHRDLVLCSDCRMVLVVEPDQAIRLASEAELRGIATNYPHLWKGVCDARQLLNKMFGPPIHQHPAGHA